MERHTTFKSSLFGFDKKLVLDYIFAFSQQAKEVEDELNRQISDLATARDDLFKQLEEAENQFEIVNAQYNAEREASQEAAKMIAELGDEIQRQKTIVEEKNRELAIQNERCKQLQLKAESMEHKSRKYDEISQQIGEIVLEAQNVAQQIVAQAKSKVAALEDAATQPEQNEIDLTAQLKDDLARIKDSMNQMFASLGSRIEALESEAKRAQSLENRIEILETGAAGAVDSAVWEKKLSKLETNLEQMQAETSAIKERISGIETTDDRLLSEHTDIKRRIGILEQDSHTTARKTTATEDKVTGLEAAFSKTSADMFALGSQVADLRSQTIRQMHSHEQPSAIPNDYSYSAYQGRPSMQNDSDRMGRQMPSSYANGGIPIPGMRAQDRIDSFFRSNSTNR